MKLIVGLGNPGQEYRATRHNIGFEVVAELARRYSAGTPRRGFEGELVELVWGGEKIMLLSPLTYMNLSGRSVGAVVDFYKLPVDSVLVVCDDLNLEAGRLRLRPRGSAGGQNGLKDILKRLATDDVPRLRVGIGRPSGRQSAIDYVLGRFTSAERELMDDTVVRGADAAELWARNGIESAMNTVNAQPTT